MKNIGDTLVSLVLLLLAVFILAGLFLADFTLSQSLQNKAEYYKRNTEELIEQFHSINQSVLLNPQNCKQLQAQYLFNGVLRELLLIEDYSVSCSSRRESNNDDIRPYLSGKPLVAGQYLFDIRYPAPQRTLVVVDVSPANPKKGIVSIVDADYFKTLFAVQDSKQVQHVHLEIGVKQYPNVAITTQFYARVTSPLYGFSIAVEATPSYAFTIYLFYILSSLSLAILSLGVLYWVWKHFPYSKPLIDDLRLAIERKELNLVYQPIIANGHIKGAEVLLRWHHRIHGHLSPNIFIPMAEQHGLIEKLTDYVIEQVLINLPKQALSDTGKLSISVNLPPCYLKRSGAFERLQEYYSAFMSIGWQPILELTERQLIDADIQTQLSKLRHLGYGIAIDDFGTGQTALSVLQSIEFDILKIDKCFVDTIDTGSLNAPVLDTILELGKRLNVHLTAEGVETETQVEYLQKRGCDYLQGYYYFPPLALDKFHQLLDESIDSSISSS